MAYQPKSYRKFLATSVTAAVVAAAVAPAAGFAATATPSFSDVKDSHYTEAVTKMAQAEFLLGTGNGKFGVGTELKRGDAALVFARVLGWDLEEVEAPGFTDVKSSDYYYAAIAKAVEEGVIKGRTATTFDPEGSLSRGEMAALLTRALDLEAPADLEVPFTDLGAYGDYIKAIYAAELTNGQTATTFGTNAKVKREDFVTFLYRDASVQETVAKKIAELEEEDVAELAVESVSAINQITGQATTVTNGSTVHPIAELELVFNGELSEETVTRNNVRLMQGDVVVGGVPSVDATDKNKLIFTPDAPLEAGEEFKLVVSKSVKAGGSELKDAYELKFNTVATSSIISLAYSDDASQAFDDFYIGANFDADVENQSLQLEYNVALDSSSVNTSNVRLYNVTDKKFVALGSVSYSASSGVLDVEFADDLEQNKKYELRIANLKDLEGKSAEAITFDFTRADITGVASRVTPSSTSNVYGLLASNPARNLIGFNYLATVNRVLDASTVNENTVYLREVETEAKVAGTVVYNATAGTINILPKADLKADTEYEVIFKGVKDEIGIAVSAPVGFETGDFVAPKVATTSITNGASVGLKDKIEIKFDKEIDSSSLVFGTSKNFNGSQTVVLLDVSGDTGIDVTSKVSWNADGDIMTLDLDGLVTQGKSYRLMLRGQNIQGVAIEDNTGNSNPLASNVVLNFVANADTTAPTIQKVEGRYADNSKFELANGSTNVNASNNVIFTFNDKDLVEATWANLSSATNAAVRVYNVTDREWVVGGSSSGQVSGAEFRIVDNNANNDTLEIAQQAFTAGKTYRIELRAGIEDASGNKFSPQSYTFTFGSGEVIALPSAFSRTAASVSNDIVLEVANLDARTLNSETVKVVKVSDSTEVAGTLSYDAASDEITFEPATDLAYGTEYNIVITTGLKDINGNSVVRSATVKPSTINYTFKTEVGNTSVTNVSVANGAINVDLQKAITVEFSDDARGSDIKLLDSLDDDVAVITWSNDGKKATITFGPNKNDKLDPFAEYTLTIDNVGEEIDETIHFTTGNTSTDEVAPEFAAFGTWNGTSFTEVPEAGGTYSVAGPLSNDIVVAFDETISTSGATVTVTNVTDDNKSVAILDTGRVNADGVNNGLRINPLSNLAAGTYKVEVKNAKDAAGNIADTVTVYLIVEPTPAP